MDRLSDRFDRFWFLPATATNLGICRIVFYALVLNRYGRVDFSAWARVPDEFWTPIWIFQHLPKEILTPALVSGVQLLWKGALLTSSIGLLTRLSTAASFLGGLFLLGFYQCFGKSHHFDAPILITLAILAFSRAGDAWSVDRSLHHRRRAPPGTLSDGEYTWPIRLAQVLLTLVFFGAGVTKLRRSGLDWIFSDNLKWILLSHHYNRDPPTLWGLYLAEIEWFPSLLALGTIVLEIGAPLALLGRVTRWIFIPGLLAMQIGIWALTGAFKPYWVLYQFWVPWDRLPTLVRSRKP